MCRRALAEDGICLCPPSDQGTCDSVKLAKFSLLVRKDHFVTQEVKEKFAFASWVKPALPLFNPLCE